MSLAPLLLILLIPVGVVLLRSLVRGNRATAQYILLRVALVVPTVLLLASLIFVLMRVVPGDPVDTELVSQSTPEQRQAIREELGLNDPLIVQYLDFLKGVVTLNFGNSVVGAQQPVTEELSHRLPATLELIIPAELFAIVIGVSLGALAAVRRARASDASLRILSVVTHSLPVFVLALLLQLVLAVKLEVLPVAGRVDPIVADASGGVSDFIIIGALLHGQWDLARDATAHLILPALTLGLVLVGINLRLTRINLIEELRSDYVYAGWTRGLSPSRVRYRYALRNAMLPVITLLGLQFGLLLGGAVVTETIFSWPGMGSYTVERIQARDYPAVQGVVVLIAILVSLTSVIVDSLYSSIDPRVRV